MSFIFGAEGLPQTPKELARMRSIANALRKRRTPKNVGEGLTALGEGIASGLYMRQANNAEKAGREGATNAFNSIMSAFGAGGTDTASVPSGSGVSFSGDIPAADLETDPVNRRIDQGFAAFGGDSVEMDGSKASFIAALMPEAQRVGAEIGVDPRIIVAQAAQETGWGRSAPGNNYFGIKSHGQEGGQALKTHEIIDGKRVNVTDSFRTYEDPSASVRGYGDFLTSNPRYKPMLEAETFDDQIAALGASGYATDPNYANSVANIARGIPMPSQVASLNPSLSPEQPAIDPKGVLRQRLTKLQGGRVSANPVAETPQVAQVQSRPGNIQKPSASVQRVAQAQQGMDQQTQQLIGLVNNPWLDPGQKAVAQALLQQRMQANDPLRQIQIERERVELDQLKNPVQKPMVVGGESRLVAHDGTVLLDAQPSEPDLPSAVREYEYAKEQGFPGSFQDWEASKKGGMSLQVDPATGQVTFQQGSNIKPMTEGQSKDAVFSTRAEGALPILDQYEQALTGVSDTLASGVPVVGNMMKSEDFQKAEQAGLEFLQAILRKDTGAAITAQEQNEYGRVYLPRPGDTADVIAQKRLSRQRALEAIKAGMPPQAILAQEKALAATGAPQAAQPGSVDTSGVMDRARAAIEKGASREAVIQRLKEAGIDPSGL